jgi:hypothetical protein
MAASDGWPRSWRLPGGQLRRQEWGGGGQQRDHPELVSRHLTPAEAAATRRYLAAHPGVDPKSLPVTKSAPTMVDTWVAAGEPYGG